MPKKPKAAAPVEDLEAELGGLGPLGEEQALPVWRLMQKGITLVQRIEKGEALLKELKAELHTLTTLTMPDVLASVGTSLFQVTDGEYAGWKVEIKPFVAGSLPKDEVKRADALQWIRDAQAGDIIKNKLSVEFERGEDNLAGEIRGKLDDLGLDYELKEDVHAQTLLAFARERMKNGEDVPLEKLGLYAGRNAKIEPPKRK